MTPDELAKLIPPEAWRAAMSTYHKTIKKRPGSAWQEAIAAALLAWPGMDTIMLPRMTKPGEFAPQDYIRLPLPQETRGDE